MVAFLQCAAAEEGRDCQLRGNLLKALDRINSKQFYPNIYLFDQQQTQGCEMQSHSNLNTKCLIDVMNWLTYIFVNLFYKKQINLLCLSQAISWKLLLSPVGALRSNKHKIKKTTFKELVGGRAVGRIGKGSVFALFPLSSLLALSRLARKGR